jgi:DNA-binding protein YbaB
MPEDARTDLRDVARRARLMREELAAAQAGADRAEVTGFGGGGLVRATVSGQGRLIGLDVDPSVIDPEDPGTLSALVVEAVGAAQAALAEQRAGQLRGVTDALGDLVRDLRPGRPGGVVPRFPDRRRAGQDGPPTAR